MAVDQFRFRLLSRGQPVSGFTSARFTRVLEDGRFMLTGVFEVEGGLECDAVEVWLIDRRLTKTGWPEGPLNHEADGMITIDYPLDLSMQSADTRKLVGRSIFGSINQDSVKRALQLKGILKEAQEKGYLVPKDNDNEFRRRVDEVLGTIDVWEEEE